MNEKEISEIRRRYRVDKSNVTHVRGCYVNEKQEIVSQFDQSLTLLPQEESENLMNVLRRTLSGTQGKNLIDMPFTTAQVVDSDEHRLLMALRNSALQDEEAVQAFFQKVIGAYHTEGTYLILLAYDTYDIPYRSKDGEKQDDASSEVYSSILCSICPVKQTKPVLSYNVPENEFQNRDIDWLVSAPAAGVLFPAFNDRSTDIYSALFYTRDTAEDHAALIDALFHCEPPMPAEMQKETFGAILGDALKEACSMEVMQTVHMELREMIEEHKVNKEIEPLTISRGTVKTMLAACGVSDNMVDVFDEKYTEEFGEDTRLSPRNLIETKKFEVTTPDVTIKVNPERSDLIETRVIDGEKYILIRAEEGVEVNGVQISIDEKA